MAEGRFEEWRARLNEAWKAVPEPGETGYSQVLKDSAIEQSARSSEKPILSERPEIKNPLEFLQETGKRFSVLALLVFLAGNAVGDPLCIAAGDHFVKREWLETAIGFGFGIPLVAIAWVFPFRADLFSRHFRASVRRHAYRWWPAAVLLAFIYVVGPEIYQRATAPAVPPMGVGFTQQQVDDKVATATKPLQDQIAALQRDNNSLRQARSLNGVPVQPSTSLSAADIATKIGVWQSVNQRMDDLAKILNEGYAMLDHWLPDAKSNRTDLINRANRLENAVQNFRIELDQLRNLYLKDADIAAALQAVYMPGGRVDPSYSVFTSLPNSIHGFAHHLQGLGDPLPASIENEMIPYVGAFRRDLNALRDWQSQVRQTAASQDAELSKMEAK